MTANPFDNQDFREEMTKLLKETIAPISEKVDAHETYIQRQQGGGSVIRYIISVVISLVAGFLGAKAHQ